MGYTARIEEAGGTVLSGMCFYQSYAREIAEAQGWNRLATNSAKLVNILGGYGYRPMLASMEACVDAAVSGKLSHDDAEGFRARHAMGRIVRGLALVAHDGFSARYDLDRIAGMFSRPSAQTRRPVLRRQNPGPGYRQRRRGDRLDAARDDIARHDAAGVRVQLGEPHSRARRRVGRFADARRI